MDHVRKLANEFGPRPVGSESERKAAEYIQQQLSSYGYATSLQAFPIETYVQVNVSLRETSPQSREFSAQALAGTVSGDADGELMHVGLGRPQDFPASASGRIALVQRGEIYFSDKVANAVSAGAIAVVIYNNQPGGFGGQVRDTGGIPAVTISQEDGQALVKELQSGLVSVSVTVEGRTQGGESRNVVAKPPSGNCRIVVGGHYDSVPDGPGANDNASGTAVSIEIARVLAADGVFDDVCFVLFGAEEIGLVGSGYYVASLSDAERGAILGMLNFDMLAVGEGWPLVGDTALVNAAGEEAEKIGMPYQLDSLPPGVGSDHAPFQQVGIPVTMFNCFCDANYHTAQDRVEFVRPERIGLAGALGAGLVERLLGRAQ